jgi:acyl-CoA hydrolase
LAPSSAFSYFEQWHETTEPLAQKLSQDTALGERADRIGVHGQGHRLLAEVDTEKSQRYGAHFSQLDSEHGSQHVIVSRCDRLWGEYDGVQTDRQPLPGWKAAIRGHRQARQQAFIGSAGSVEIDGLTRKDNHALATAKNRDPAKPDRAVIVSQNVERWLAKLFPALKLRASLLQDGLDEIDEIVLNHGAGSPGSSAMPNRDKLGGEQRSVFMTNEAIPAKPASASRVTLAIITEPWQSNPNDTIHGGVILKLVDECGAIAALRHAGKGMITTAAIDSMTFIGPVYVGERVEISAEVTYAGRTSIETRIEVFAEPIENAVKRKVGVGYGLYVALDLENQRPRQVPSLLIETEADRINHQAAQARQAARLARRAEARGQ